MGPVVPFEVIDLASVAEFTDWLAVCGTGDDAEVVLDFAAVQMVLAVGVQALLDLERELLRSGRALTIVHAAPIVRRVFEICEVADRWLA